MISKARRRISTPASKRPALIGALALILPASCGGGVKSDTGTSSPGAGGSAGTSQAGAGGNAAGSSGQPIAGSGGTNGGGASGAPNEGSAGSDVGGSAGSGGGSMWTGCMPLGTSLLCAKLPTNVPYQWACYEPYDNVPDGWSCQSDGQLFTGGKKGYCCDH